MEVQEAHDILVTTLSRKVKEFSNRGIQVRIFHGSTNSTRAQNFDATKLIDTSGLNCVIEVNAAEGYAIVEPNVPMDGLVEACLQQGMIPPVVMEFPGITVGGGIQGGAGESSSFKEGLFHARSTI